MGKLKVESRCPHECSIVFSIEEFSSNATEAKLGLHFECSHFSFFMASWFFQDDIRSLIIWLTSIKDSFNLRSMDGDLVLHFSFLDAVDSKQLILGFSAESELPFGVRDSAGSTINVSRAIQLRSHLNMLEWLEAEIIDWPTEFEGN